LIFERVLRILALTTGGLIAAVELIRQQAT
jgi:hypothetical protein